MQNPGPGNWSCPRGGPLSRVLLLAAGRGGLLKGLPGHTHTRDCWPQAGLSATAEVHQGQLPVLQSGGCLFQSLLRGLEGGLGGWCAGPQPLLVSVLDGIPIALETLGQLRSLLSVCSCRGGPGAGEGSSLDPHACSKQEKRPG